MKPQDFKPGDILRKDDELWNVEYVFPEKLVLVRRIDVRDLTEWEKVEAYDITGKSALNDKREGR